MYDIIVTIVYLVSSLARLVDTLRVHLFRRQLNGHLFSEP